MAEEPKPHGWWQSIPGILTTMAGIITAVTALIVALQQAGIFQKNPEPQVASNSPKADSQVAGTWEMHQTGGSPEHLGMLTLIQEGRRLRGTLVWKTAGLEPSAEIVDGQISGEQVTILVRYPKSNIEGTYVGTLESPNRLSGNARGGGGTAGWHATR